MSEPKRVVYRGVPMIEGWPEKIIAAQQIGTCVMRDAMCHASVMAMNNATGALKLFTAMIAEFSRATSMSPVAM